MNTQSFKLHYFSLEKQNTYLFPFLEYLLKMYVQNAHFRCYCVCRSANISPCTIPFPPTAPEAMKPAMRLRK